MPFNSSTPKIDDYYISSGLATAKLGRHQSNETAQLRLRSGLRLYSNDGRKLLKSAFSQQSRKYCTYVLFTVSSPKKQPRTSATALPQKSTDPPLPISTPPSLKPHRYTIHSGWLFTLFTNVIENSSLLERKGKKPPHSLCFSLFLHIVMVPNKSDYIHSLGMLTSGFQDPPVWQLVDDDRQTITRLQTTQRNVHNQEMSYTVFPQCTSVHLRVCL